jgi:hypothetical protein
MASARLPNRLAFAVPMILAAGLQAAPVAAASIHALPALDITACAEHYVVNGRFIDDLGALEAQVASSGARTVRLYGFEGVSDRSQRAAAHRFRALNLELSLLQRHAGACRPTGSRGPLGIDDAAVDQWWHAWMP